MSEARRAVSLLIGGVQCGFGVLASILTFLIYASPTVREAFAIASEEVYLYMFLLLVFGILSVLSGLLLAREQR